MKNDPVLAALSALDDVPVRTPEGLKQIAKALTSKSNLVVAKAARIVGESQWTELTDDLLKAFDRLVKRGAEADKGCAAMTAIARALYALDYDGADLYLAGMHHVQREAGYLRPTDTAVELRAVCAMGLASTNCRHKMRELVDLLADSEWQARAGAVRAIAAVGSEAAALLLRLKTHLGDEEPDVLADCFSGLIEIEGSEALPLVTSFAKSGEEEVRDAAILALGASRRAEAVDWLKQRFGQVADQETRQSILLALATSRTEAAIEFVLGVVRNGSEHSSAMAVAAMEVNRGESRIREELETALKERREPGSSAPGGSPAAGPKP